MNAPLLFAPTASRPFGERMAAALGTRLAPLEEREYEGGEHKIRALVAVRGQNVYVVQSLSGDAFPAVTVLSSANTGLSCANFSSEVSLRRFSSLSNSVPGTGTTQS